MILIKWCVNWNGITYLAPDLIITFNKIILDFGNTG